MNEICDMLLYWTMKQYSPETCSGGADHFRDLSPEVYDRAVSVIGIVVPCGIYLLAIASIFMLMWIFVRVFGGGYNARK